MEKKTLRQSGVWSETAIYRPLTNNPGGYGNKRKERERSIKKEKKTLMSPVQRDLQGKKKNRLPGGNLLMGGKEGVKKWASEGT